MLSRRILTVLLCLTSLSLADDAKVTEEYVVYSGSAGNGISPRVWGMKHEERDGHIYLNENWRGEPWAGMMFSQEAKGSPMLTLTAEWVELGFVRLRINGLADRYGNCGAPCQFQLRLMGIGDRYQRIRGSFYERGVGIDSDPETWQEVFVPIKYFGAKPGDKVMGVSLQCVMKPTRVFAVDRLSLVRFSGPRDADQKKTEMTVAQPWVTWPDYEDLPPALKFDKNPPMYRDGRFVTADGRRTFIITTWGRENQLTDLGVGGDGKMVANYGLYDAKTQGFIYEQPLNGESMSRLGFNCYAGQVYPVPFWKAIGYKGKDWQWGKFPDRAFRDHVRNMGTPFYVDMVCFPWTLGKPALDKETNLPPEALHNGRQHWTPYRIIGKGEDIWLTMWRTYAQRYKNAGAKVIFYEFMNEPAYLATTPDHRDELIEWLKQRYETLEKVNETWGTSYNSWDEIRNFKKLRENTGIFFDYDEYLGDRFADLIAAGRRVIEEITPGVPAAIQTMGGYCLQPRDGIYLSKLIPHERAVLTPTGGGRWSRHVNNDAPKENTIEYGMSGAPISNDLLLAMAGNKMIVDNEMYLGPKQTRKDLRNRWWKEVIVGLDGASWFSWSKRGWAWWRGKENIMREADLFPYSNLIPYARRADAIRGALEFAKEMELVREYVLPKPWGPRPKVGMIYSWSNTRWRVWDRQLRDKSGDYHAAMKYLHWNFDVIPANMASKSGLARHELLVAGGIDHVEPDLVDLLSDYVRNGGTLIVGEGVMRIDLYGKPINTEAMLGLKVTRSVGEPMGKLKTIGLPDFKLIPGDIVSRAGGNEIELLPETQSLWIDSRSRPVVTCHAFGEGRVYYIAADLVGYPLAKILGAICQREGPRPAIEITDAVTGQLAPNILISRRSYDDRHALILMNPDEFPKLIRIRIRDLDGDWYVSDPLEGHELINSSDDARWTSTQIANEGMAYCITGENRGLLLFTRKPWSKTKLNSATASRLRNVFDTEFGLWKQGR